MRRRPRLESSDGRSGGSTAAGYPEMRHQFRGFAGISVQHVAGCGGLFHHGCVLLGDLVQLDDTCVDLIQPGRLPGRTFGNAGYQLRSKGDLLDSALQRLACLADQIDTALYLS